jgi:hypothetical protein
MVMIDGYDVVGIPINELGTLVLRHLAPFHNGPSVLHEAFKHDEFSPKGHSPTSLSA